VICKNKPLYNVQPFGLSFWKFKLEKLYWASLLTRGFVIPIGSFVAWDRPITWTIAGSHALRWDHDINLICESGESAFKGLKYEINQTLNRDTFCTTEHPIIHNTDTLLGKFIESVYCCTYHFQTKHIKLTAKFRSYTCWFGWNSDYHLSCELWRT